MRARTARAALASLGFFLVVPHGVREHGESAFAGKILVRNELKHEPCFAENAKKVVITDVSVDKERCLEPAHGRQFCDCNLETIEGCPRLQPSVSPKGHSGDIGSHFQRQFSLLAIPANFTRYSVRIKEPDPLADVVNVQVNFQNLERVMSSIARLQ